MNPGPHDAPYHGATPSPLPLIKAYFQPSQECARQSAMTLLRPKGASAQPTPPLPRGSWDPAFAFFVLRLLCLVSSPAHNPRRYTDSSCLLFREFFINWILPHALLYSSKFSLHAASETDCANVQSCHSFVFPQHIRFLIISFVIRQRHHSHFPAPAGRAAWNLPVCPPWRSCESGRAGGGQGDPTE